MEPAVKAPTTTSGVYDAGLAQYMAEIFRLMALGLFVTGIVSYITMSSSLLAMLVDGTPGRGGSLSGLWWLIAIAELGLVFWMSWWMKKRTISMRVGASVFLIYAVMNGLTLSPAVSVYTAESVTQVFFMTSAGFGACALYGYTTKHDLSALGAFLIIGLVGLIAATIANFWIQSSALSFALTVMGLLIFAGLTAWDMQVFKTEYLVSGYSPALVINGALNLYLDFLNIFLELLRLFGVRRD